ncbi:hypothetical protein D3C87_1130170 [compost metagenome]
MPSFWIAVVGTKRLSRLWVWMVPLTNMPTLRGPPLPRSILALIWRVCGSTEGLTSRILPLKTWPGKAADSTLTGAPTLSDASSCSGTLTCNSSGPDPAMVKSGLEGMAMTPISAERSITMPSMGEVTVAFCCWVSIRRMAALICLTCASETLVWVWACSYCCWLIAPWSTRVRMRSRLLWALDRFA